MSKVTLLNTLPRPHSVPYSLATEDNPRTLSATEWIIINPGISIEIEDYIWDRIKNHPDVKYYLEQRSLFIVNNEINANIEKLDQIEALVSGELVKALDQPIPVAVAGTNTTNAPIAPITPTEEKPKATTAKTTSADK